MWVVEFYPVNKAILVAKPLEAPQLQALTAARLLPDESRVFFLLPHYFVEAVKTVLILLCQMKGIRDEFPVLWFSCFENK